MGKCLELLLLSACFFDPPVLCTPYPDSLFQHRDSAIEQASGFLNHSHILILPPHLAHYCDWTLGQTFTVVSHSALAAITGYHRPGSLNNRKLSSHILEAGSPR